jgi:hypothetical protein
MSVFKFAMVLSQYQTPERIDNMAQPRRMCAKTMNDSMKQSSSGGNL